MKTSYLSGGMSGSGSIQGGGGSCGKGTSIGRVRGLAGSHHGSGHWLQQRLTALGNLLLDGWFVVSLLRLPLGDHGAVLRWASNPMVALGLILMVVSVFWHLDRKSTRLNSSH